MKIEYYVEFGERSSHTGREVAWYDVQSSVKDKLYILNGH